MDRFINWFFRYNERTNRTMARCARMLARMVTRIARLLPGSVRQYFIGFANVLENFALTLELPQQGRSTNLNALLLDLFYAGVIGFWFSSMLPLSALIGPFSWLIGIVLLLTFAILALFLLVS